MQKCATIFYLKFNSLHSYLSPTSCLDPDVPLNKLVRPGDKLGLSGKSPDVLFPPNSASEPVLCTTGKYPNLECFLKYFFDLNLFLSSFVKSRISSPDVVYKEKIYLIFIEHILGHDFIVIYFMDILLPLCSTLASDEPFYDFCTFLLCQQRNNFDTCQS